MKYPFTTTRRRLLQFFSLGALGMALPVLPRAASDTLITRAIPSTNERIPVIGLGSSRTFNVGRDPAGLENVTAVMRGFFSAGGRLIDSSPMYGSSQAAIGYALNALGKRNEVLAADKVWTWDSNEGPEQIEQSRNYWQIDAFALMQVHNLVKWESHLQTLLRFKQQGKIRYVGITTSHGRQHDEFEEVMKTQPLDFVQISYNVLDRDVEQRILPLARKRGIAVIINRPFQRGELIDRLSGKPLPSWAERINCKSWPQFLLKFVVSHPDVTCTIPATSQLAHLLENMQAGYGLLPDTAMRRRMIDYVQNIL